ncbi:tripartite motif-containing protein 16-like isoform X2 [Conger conger]|uniref:tripartite motif-containing protein 16-like isoform X2 n=1 Tax=Conger conger TaxID=82655 RepID=UPI002A59D935|nr:tripartite motif-containing protein 16-like isoform X2 [Conger conger]
MDESSTPEDQDQLCCPVCLALLNSPVTIGCGHSFCMNCIRCWWEKEGREEGTGNYSCPVCQHTFNPRPVLCKNVLLADLVEKNKPGPGSGAVWCDVCPRGTQLALKSCLRCVASYCEAHLKPHYESPAFQRHQLTESAGNLQEMVCTLHKEPLKVYCRTDQRCVCFLCVMDEHKNHDTVSAVAEHFERQKSLSAEREKILKWIQEKETKLQDMRQGENLLTTAQKAVADNERLFADIIQAIERQRSKVKELILSEQKAAEAHSTDLKRRLQEEITQLRRREAKLQKLAQTDDHIRFLQGWRSLTAPHCAVAHVTADPQLSFVSVIKAVTELRYQLMTFCQGQCEKMSEKVCRVNEVAALPSRKHRARAESPLSSATFRAEFQNIRSGETGSGCGHPAIKVQVLESMTSLPEPRTRGDFLRYACELTLDLDTAHVKLLLSAGNREVTCVKERQKYPNNSERFDCRCQILSREALSGRRCYWEVEVRGNKAEIAVAYKGIKRKGGNRASSFGGNDKSWSLDAINGVYSFCHNNDGIQLRAPYCSKVGVYLDHPGGTLSFYSVSGDMTLLYSVPAVFTEPVYAGFWIGEQCAVKLLDLT